MDALPATRLHWAVVVICALGLLFDVVEAGLSNALSAVFSAPPHQVAPGQLSLLLASVFIGGAVGAPLLGLVADRFGRRVALGGSLMLLTITSLLAATSHDIAWLTAYRVLSGLALGAYPPLMAAYLADLLPPVRRGRMILVGAAIGFLGAPLVIFIIRALTPIEPMGLEGWRWALIIGAVGSLLVGLLFLVTPESPRWLIARGRHAEADEVCRRFERSAGLGAPAVAPAPDALSEAAALPSRRTILQRALLFGTLDFLSPWATIGFPLLSGAVLIGRGFQVSESLLYVGVSMFGPTIGVLLGTLFVDRLERRVTLVLCAIVMAALGVAFAGLDAPVLLMATGLGFTLVGSIYITTLNVYAAEVFPTAWRATVSSGAWGVNRIAAALVPLALLPLLKTSGAIAMFTVVAAVLVTSALLLVAFGPRQASGRPVV